MDMSFSSGSTSSKSKVKNIHKNTASISKNIDDLNWQKVKSESVSWNSVGKGSKQTSLADMVFSSTKTKNSSYNPKSKYNSKHKRRSWFTYSLAFLALVLGIVYIVNGLKTSYADAPLPDVMVVAPDDQQPVGPYGDTDPVETNAGMMTTADMAPGSIFIPAIGAYSEIDPSSAFEGSGYAGFYSIKIPDDAQRSFWYEPGGPLVGGDEGTTLVGGHYGYRNNPGAFQRLYTMRGGEIIWTKDFDGNLQEWQTTEMFYLPHTQFPQEFWDASGVRRLVVTTCGGTASDNGTFSNNVFAVAKPLRTFMQTANTSEEESQSGGDAQSRV